MVDSVVASRQIDNGDHVAEQVGNIGIASEYPKTDGIVSWLQHVQVEHLRAVRTMVDTRHVLSNREFLGRTVTGVQSLTDISNSSSLDQK